MNANFSQILEMEKVNDNHVHLFLNDEGTKWVAYGKSALNLQKLAPTLVNEEVNVNFWMECFQLFRVTFNRDISEESGLLMLCSLLEEDCLELIGDDYIELIIPQNRK